MHSGSQSNGQRLRWTNKTLQSAMQTRAASACAPGATALLSHSSCGCCRATARSLRGSPMPRRHPRNPMHAHPYYSAGCNACSCQKLGQQHLLSCAPRYSHLRSRLLTTSRLSCSSSTKRTCISCGCTCPAAPWRPAMPAGPLEGGANSSAMRCRAA